MIITIKDYPFIRRLIAKVTNNRKQKAIITFCDKVTLSGTFWDGGSRSTYTLVTWSTDNPNDMVAQPLAQYAPPQFGGPKQDPVVVIGDNQAVVETGIFCGKVAAPHVFIREFTLTK